MDDLSGSKLPDAVVIKLSTTQYALSSGESCEIEISLANPGTIGDYFLVSLLDLPQGWVAPSGPLIVWLAPGAQDKVVFKVTPTTQPEAAGGTYPGRVNVSRQNSPDLAQDKEITLVVSLAQTTRVARFAFESPGRIGVSLGSIQFAATPGETTTIPITLTNRGLDRDTFRLGVEGIPLSWVSTDSPTVTLSPGEQREVSLLIQPALAPTSLAGRNKFRLSVSSQATPDQTVKVECV